MYSIDSLMSLLCSHVEAQMARESMGSYDQIWRTQEKELRDLKTQILIWKSTPAVIELQHDMYSSLSKHAFNIIASCYAIGSILGDLMETAEHQGYLAKVADEPDVYPTRENIEISIRKWSKKYKSTMDIMVSMWNAQFANFPIHPVDITASVLDNAKKSPGGMTVENIRDAYNAHFAAEKAHRQSDT